MPISRPCCGFLHFWTKTLSSKTFFRGLDGKTAVFHHRKIRRLYGAFAANPPQDSTKPNQGVRCLKRVTSTAKIAREIRSLSVFICITSYRKNRLYVSFKPLLFLGKISDTFDFWEAEQAQQPFVPHDAPTMRNVYASTQRGGVVTTASSELENLTAPQKMGFPFLTKSAKNNALMVQLAF